jgi:hypothetical protein
MTVHNQPPVGPGTCPYLTSATLVRTTCSVDLREGVAQVGG